MAKNLENNLNKTQEDIFQNSQGNKTSRSKNASTLNEKGEYVDFEEIKE